MRRKKSSKKPDQQIKATPLWQAWSKMELEKMPQRMSIAQTAAFMNCTPRHVANLVDEGRLRAVDLARAGSPRRTLRIIRESVGEFEAAQNTLCEAGESGKLSKPFSGAKTHQQRGSK
jgi:hypothetical protein